MHTENESGAPDLARKNLAQLLSSGVKYTIGFGARWTVEHNAYGALGAWFFRSSSIKRVIGKSRPKPAHLPEASRSVMRAR
jgi:hypothetical protein